MYKNIFFNENYKKIKLKKFADNLFVREKSPKFKKSENL